MQEQFYNHGLEPDSSYEDPSDDKHKNARFKEYITLNTGTYKDALICYDFELTRAGKLRADTQRQCEAAVRKARGYTSEDANAKSAKSRVFRVPG
jgi:hypothetical protein